MSGIDTAGWQGRLRDAGRCPVCGGGLTAPACPTCGADLSGPVGHELWTLDRTLADLLDQRTELLGRLPRSAPRPPAPTAPAPTAPAPTAPAPTAPVPSAPAPSAPPPSGAGPAPVLTPWQPGSPAPAPTPGLFSRIGVQGLLVGLGALLVAVAGVVFLVFAWDRLALAGRASVVAVLTLAAMAGAAALRRPRVGMPETAEAVGVIATVLVLTDAWAVRATGLFGADRWNPLGYSAAALGLCTVLLFGWARSGRVRAGSLTASVLAPLVPVLAGGWLVDRTERALPLGLGLLGSVALGAVLLAAGERLLPPSWGIERRITAVAGVIAWWLAVLSFPIWLGRDLDDGSVDAAVMILGLVATAVLHALVGRAARGRPSGAWTAGATGTLALLPLAVTVPVIAERSGDDSDRVLLTTPAIGAALVALVLALLLRPGGAVSSVLPVRPALRSARWVSVALLLPAITLLIDRVVAVLSSAEDRWTASVGDSVEQVLGVYASVQDGGVHAWAAGGLLGTGVLLLAGSVLGARARRGRRPAAARGSRWTTGATGLIGAGASSVALAGWAPIGLAVALLIVIAVAAAVGSGRAARAAAAAGRPGAGPGPGPTWLRWPREDAVLLAVALGAGVLAVFLGRSVRALSVPVTVAGALALLTLRPAVAGWLRRLLPAATVSSLALTAGTAPAVYGTGEQVELRAVGLAGAALAVLALLVPLPRRVVGRDDLLTDRAWAALTGVAFSAYPAFGALAGDWGPAWAVGLALALLVAVAAVALLAVPESPESPESPEPADPTRSGEPVACLVGAGAVPVAVVLAAVAGPVAQPVPDLGLARLLAAAVLLGSAVAATTAALGGLHAPRRLGIAWAALTALVVLVGAAGVAAEDWAPLGVLGAAAAVLALTPGRTRVAWLGWAFGLLANAFRLADADVGLVEAYTLPPAVVLLAVAAFLVHRRRRGRPVPPMDLHTTLVPGLGLAILPSVVEAADGSPWRPALLIGAACLLLALAAGRVGRDLRRVLLPAAVVAAAGAAVVRAGSAWLDGRTGPAQVEVWTLPAAAVLLAGGWMVLADSTWGTRSSWPTLGPGLALLLVPSLLTALDGQPISRVVGLIVLAAAVVGVGVLRRLQAPVVGGAVVLAVHVLVQLAPWISRLVAGVPRWVVIGAVGLALLGLGATYERRLRNLRDLRLRIGQLR